MLCESALPWRYIAVHLMERHPGSCDAFAGTTAMVGTSRNAQVVRCPLEEVAQQAQQAHVLVPFMARLDKSTIASARSVRLIIQYGVGVEGIDIPAVALGPKARAVCHEAAARALPAFCYALHYTTLASAAAEELACLASRLRKWIRMLRKLAF